MKKLVGILTALVLILGGLLIYENVTGNVNESNESVHTNTSPTPAKQDSNEMKTYKFKDIETYKKAKSVEEAFTKIFGKDRLFDDFQENESYNGSIMYYLEGIYKTDNMEQDKVFTYFPDRPYFFRSIYINIAMEPGKDTRMEMIDFLHYLQYSGLTKPNLVSETLPADSVKIDLINPTTPEKIPSFGISMKVFQKIKPGMNTPESHQGWSLSSEVIEVMDFSNKEELLGSIHMYGEFEGINPSGMQQ